MVLQAASHSIYFYAWVVQQKVKWLILQIQGKIFFHEAVLITSFETSERWMDLKTWEQLFQFMVQESLTLLLTAISNMRENREVFMTL